MSFLHYYNIYYFVVFIFFILATIVNLYLVIIKRYRIKELKKKIGNILYWIMFLPLLDIFSTLLVINKYNTLTELNIVGRFILTNFGNFKILGLYLFTFIGLYDIFVFIFYATKPTMNLATRLDKKYFNTTLKKEQTENVDLKIFKIILLITYIFLFCWNISFLW